MDYSKHFERGILAIDPATQFGFAYLDGGQLIHGSYSLAVTSSDSWGLRAWRLFNWVIERPAQAEPALIVYEDASMGAHQLNIIKFHGMLAGAIECAAGQLGIPTKTIGPMVLKMWATNHGRAKKEQMMGACRLHYGISPGDHNAADAILLMGIASEHARGKVRLDVARVKKRTQRTSKAETPRLFK